MKIAPATDDEMRAAILRLHSELATASALANKRSSFGVEPLARIIAAPRIRARLRRGYQDSLSAAVRRIDGLLRRSLREGQQRLAANIWNVLNERDLNVALADNRRRVRSH